MAASALKSMEGIYSTRCQIMRPIDNSVQPSTPLRQKVNVLTCPDAPRKRQRCEPGQAAFNWHGQDLDEEVAKALPFWTNGQPLESFTFEGSESMPQKFSVPQFPRHLSDLPPLGLLADHSKEMLLNQLSPLPSRLRSLLLQRGDDNREDVHQDGRSRKRLRIRSQRQLKFDVVSSPANTRSNASSVQFPRLSDFNLTPLMSSSSVSDVM